MMEIVRQPKLPLHYACPVCGTGLDAHEADGRVGGEIVCPQCGTRCTLRPGEAVGANAQARPAMKVVPTGMSATIRLE